MARKFTSKSFTIDHVSWFKGEFGFMPTQSDLEGLFDKEPGAADLLLCIFSESYMQKKWKQELEEEKREND